MGSYVVKPRADQDLDEYADYLAEASLALALRFFDLAHRTFALLATQPNMGWRSRIKHPDLETLRVFRVEGFEHMLICIGRCPRVLRLYGSFTVRETFKPGYAVKQWTKSPCDRTVTAAGIW